MWQERPRESNDAINIGTALPFTVTSGFPQQQFLTSVVDPRQMQMLEQLRPAPSVVYYTLVPSTTTAETMSSSSDSLGEESTPTASTRPKRVFDERCVVCGDMATGMHYSVASCNGCKTFFRRTFISGRKYICSKNDKCGINPRARCCCRACRFKKCLDAGMDPEVIQPSREENYVRPTRSRNDTAIVSSRDLRTLIGNVKSRTDTPLSSSSSSSSVSSALPVPPHLDTKTIQDIIENDDLRDLVTQEVKLYALRLSCRYNGGVLLDILTRPPAIEMQSLTQFSNSASLPVFVDVKSRTEFWLNYDLSISIEFAKTNEVFRSLSFCDKCLLLEDTHVALFIFTAAYEAYFNQGKSIHYTNGDEVVFGKETRSPYNLIDMMVRCRLDAATFAISKSIILLNSDILGLSFEGRTQVEAERERFVRLLSSYLFRKFGDDAVSILGECILLSDTALALGRQFRLQPPANASLLYLTTHVHADDT